MGVRRRGAMLRLVRGALWLGAGVFALTVLAVLMASWRLAPAEGSAPTLAVPVDAVIVLGGGVDGDGRLGYSSRRRVDAVVALLASGAAGHAIMTGGLGAFHEVTPAASMMRALAIAEGAEPERVIVEPRSVSTFENLRFAFEIAERRGFERLAILSDPFHLPRAGALAAYFGRPDIARVAASGFERDNPILRTATLIREALAWWYNLAKVGAWEAGAALGMSESAREAWIR